MWVDSSVFVKCFVHICLPGPTSAGRNYSEMDFLDRYSLIRQKGLTKGASEAESRNFDIFREAIETDATALKQTSNTHQKVAAAAIKEEREKILKASYAGRTARTVPGSIQEDKAAKKSWKDKPLSAGQKCFNCPATHKVFECDDACRLSTCTIPTEKHAAKDCPSIFNDALFQQLLKVE